MKEVICISGESEDENEGNRKINEIQTGESYMRYECPKYTTCGSNEF